MVLKVVTGKISETSKLWWSTNHQLHMYALAASAAGVGILAWAQAAEAKIVYTPANVSINPHVPYKLDLNHHGIADFTLSIHTFSTPVQVTESSSLPITVRGAQKSNAAVVGSKGYVRAFGLGIPVGPKVALNNKALMGHCLEQSGPMTSVHTSKGLARRPESLSRIEVHH